MDHILRLTWAYPLGEHREVTYNTETHKLFFQSLLALTPGQTKSQEQK